jgi:hypothetical protein
VTKVSIVYVHKGSERMMKGIIPDVSRITGSFKNILLTGIFASAMLCLFSSPLYGEENTIKTWLKTKTEKVNISTRTDESVDFDYSLPSGSIIRDKRALQGTATTGDFTITGSKFKENELTFSGGGGAERITSDLSLLRRVNSRTMLKASFREQKLEGTSFREFVTFEAEHKMGDEGPTFIISGTREDRNDDEKLRNSYRARLTQRLGNFAVMEFSGGESFINEDKKTNLGAKITKKLSHNIQVGVSRDTEVNIRDQRRDRTSFDVTSGLGASAKLRARYQLIDDYSKVIHENKLNLTYEQKVFDNRMKVIAGYEIRQRNTETQKASIGIQRETSLGNFVIKYMKETSNRTWSGNENGVFMGITSRF